MLTTQEVSRLLDIANAGINKGEITAARKVYEGILAGRPEHAPALISLALSHIVVGEYEEAETILRTRVLEKNPQDPDAKVYLGLCAYLSGRKDEAAEILKTIPEDASAHQLAASLLAEI